MDIRSRVWMHAIPYLSIVERQAGRVLGAISVLLFSSATMSSGLFAAPIETVYGSITGHIDPFTYTDTFGTATTSTILLSQDNSAVSFAIIDAALGTASEHLVMIADFTDGRGHSLEGTLTLDFSGSLDVLSIDEGGLSGAGQFDGSILTGASSWKHGKDCPSGEGGLRWCHVFLVPPDPGPYIFLQLPPAFTPNTPFAVSGSIEAAAVPEPASLMLLIAALPFCCAVSRKSTTIGRWAKRRGCDHPMD